MSQDELTPKSARVQPGEDPADWPTVEECLFSEEDLQIFDRLRDEEQARQREQAGGGLVDDQLRGGIEVRASVPPHGLATLLRA